MGLVSIGAMVVVGVGFEIYYVWYWRRVTYKYEITTVEYEPMCDRENSAEKDVRHSKR